MKKNEYLETDTLYSREKLKLPKMESFFESAYKLKDRAATSREKRLFRYFRKVSTNLYTEMNRFQTKDVISKIKILYDLRKKQPINSNSLI